MDLVFENPTPSRKGSGRSTNAMYKFDSLVSRARFPRTAGRLRVETENNGYTRGSNEVKQFRLKERYIYLC